ncbi:ferritin family protein [bacterium]|nr:ferritin family protein [bacterium]
MRELNLKEIIEYAEKIELESFSFYKKATEIVNEPEVKDVLSQLATEETEHYNRLRGLLEEGKLSKEELEKTINIEKTLLEMLINTDEIETSFSALDVLNIALKREKNTAKAYEMFKTFTALDDFALKVFEDLRLQEVGHVNKISARLKKYE